MKKFVLLINVCFLFFSCSFFKPVTLIIQNDSDFKIKVTVSDGNKKDFFLESGKGDFILIYKERIDINIRIEETGFEKKYTVLFDVYEDRKFCFDIKNGSDS
jgi:hypothetical protein